MTVLGDHDPESTRGAETTVTWLVQQENVVPRQFLTAGGTWGGAATAEQFGTEEQARRRTCPVGSTGIAIRMHRLVRRVGDDSS
jgi:hypothetical protein